jgi:hypothetical protein
VHVKKFNDFIDRGENYLQPLYTIQLMVKDRYRSAAVALTVGFSLYAYVYEQPGKPHNPLNNSHRVDDSIHDHKIFIIVHTGFL